MIPNLGVSGLKQHLLFHTLLNRLRSVELILANQKEDMIDQVKHMSFPALDTGCKFLLDF